jgi:hypothetical protein
LACLFIKDELQGPKLALLIVLVQSGAHIFLGGMSTSNTSMLLTHVAGGIFSFILITQCESAIGELFDCAKSLLSIWIPKIQVVELPEHATLINFHHPRISDPMTCKLSRRGPPSTLGASA